MAVEHTLGQRAAQMEPLAREEPPGERGPADPLQHAAARHAVAVEEHEVVAARLERREVEDPRTVGSLVGLGHVIERDPERVTAAPHQVRGLRARSVLGDDDLDLIIHLLRQRMEDNIERCLPLVGRDDHGQLDPPPQSDGRHGRAA